MSFAAELNEKGDYEEALDAAAKDIAARPANPEGYADRAAAYDGLERYAEAAADLEQAIVLNRATRVLLLDDLDDAFFSALVGAAQVEAATSVDAGVARLARYTEILPSGRHVAEASDWRKRIRGELKSLLDKTTEMGPG